MANPLPTNISSVH